MNLKTLACLAALALCAPLTLPAQKTADNAPRRRASPAWCGSTRPQAERVQVQTDPHSPRQFRVNGVVQNMPELGEAFGCKPGQPMMPTNACRVW